MTLVNVKTSHAVVYEDGQDILLYGERVGADFPWDIYAAKYGRRSIEEQDDGDAAPAGYTNFVWANCPHETLSRRVLKTMWNAERVSCPNCDVPLVIVAFEWRKGLLSFRSARIVRVCLHCRRRFEVMEEEPLAWLASVLPAHLRPVSLRLWAAVPIDWLELSLGRGRVAHAAGCEG